MEGLKGLRFIHGLNVVYFNPVSMGDPLMSYTRSVEIFSTSFATLPNFNLTIFWWKSQLRKFCSTSIYWQVLCDMVWATCGKPISGDARR